MAKNEYPLDRDELALEYHLLEAMTGTPAEPPVEELFIDEALSEYKKQLDVSPFSRARVRQALRSMSADGLVAGHRRDRRRYYTATDMGRRAYGRYKEVMILWRLEKEFGKKPTLRTITQISPRKRGQDKLYMFPMCYVRLPLAYKPIEHRFEGDREIRIYDVNLRRVKK